MSGAFVTFRPRPQAGPCRRRGYVLDKGLLTLRNRALVERMCSNRWLILGRAKRPVKREQSCKTKWLQRANVFTNYTLVLHWYCLLKRFARPICSLTHHKYTRMLFYFSRCGKSNVQTKTGVWTSDHTEVTTSAIVLLLSNDSDLKIGKEFLWYSWYARLLQKNHWMRDDLR